MEIDRRRTWDFKVDSFRVKMISDKDHPLKVNPRVIVIYNESRPQEFNTTLEELKLAVRTMTEIQEEDA